MITPSLLRLIGLGIIAYLLGSIPSAVWIGKSFFGKDVRDYGSHNAGTTNVMRVLGVKAGIPVLIIDVLKGFLAVKLAQWAIDAEGMPLDGNDLVAVQIGLGVLAVLGHMLPIFARFKGGKGVATLLGIVCALHGPATLVALGVFIFTLFLSHYVSLSSIMAGLTFPIAVILIFKEPKPLLIGFSVFAGVALLWTHRKNILRLCSGEEGKATFLFKNKDENPPSATTV